jgi:outer membrane protein assembly factor BamD
LKRALGFRVTVLAAIGLAAIGGTGCKKKKANTVGELLRADLAYRRGMEEFSKRNLPEAVASFGRIQYGPETLEEFEPLTRLGMADATFYQGTQISLIDARSLYLDFVTLYGTHPLAPYALTQAGLCSLGQVNHPTKDQSQTYQALMDLQEVMRRYPDSWFAGAAEGLTEEARSHLAESEFMVGRFYMKRKKFLAALERFRTILDDYPEFGETEKVLYHVARSLFKLDNEERARIYLSQLLADYPGGPYDDPARKLLAKLGPLDETAESTGDSLP